MNSFSEPLADSIPVAAARLGVSRSLAYRLIKNGELQALKVHGRAIISRAEQDRFMASLAAAPAQQAA